VAFVIVALLGSQPPLPNAHSAPGRCRQRHRHADTVRAGTGGCRFRRGQARR